MIYEEKPDEGLKMNNRPPRRRWSWKRDGLTLRREG